MRRRPKLRLVGKGEGDGGAAGIFGDGGATSIFDDMDKLRSDLAGTGVTPVGSVAANDDPRPTRRAKTRETFAPIPHDRALELYRRRIGDAAWVALIELDRMIFVQHGKNPVTFWSPRLRAAGLRANVRARALRRLEAAGVVEVEWRKAGLSPLVRHLWYPRQG